MVISNNSTVVHQTVNIISRLRDSKHPPGYSHHIASINICTCMLIVGLGWNTLENYINITMHLHDLFGG